MIRLIDDGGNNLTFPLDMDNSEMATMIMDSLKIDILLRELREKSVEYVVSRMLELKIADYTDILQIVSRLFEEAAISVESQDKYGELAKKLIHVLPSLLTRNKIENPRFKPRELIAIKVEREFKKVVENKKPTMHYEINRDRGMTMFLAHLYNIDMILDDSLFLLLVLLTSRQRKHKYIKLLLKQIKPRVLQKMSKPSVRNQGTMKLHKFMIENKIIVDKNGEKQEDDQDGDDSDSDASNTDETSSDSDNECESDSEKPSTSKSVKKPQSSVKKATKASKKDSKASKSISTDQNVDIVKLFGDHLTKLTAKKQSNFDIQLFKTCNDDEKRQCAKKLLITALNDSEQSKIYAELVLSILQLSIPTKISKKNFNVFLKEAFEEQMKILLDQIEDEGVDWILLEAIGKFLAELYVLDSLKVSVFNNWLEEIKSLAIGIHIALKILLNVFKIFQSSMKKRDENAYKNFMEFLKEFRINDQIPDEHVEWINGLIKEFEREKQAAISEKNKASNSTGVVKKTSSQPTSTPYQTSQKLQQFLLALKNDKSTSYENYKIQNTSTESLQDCASIFLENCIIDPEMGDVYSEALNSTILPALSQEHQAKFKKYLKYYIYTEMAITANSENYDASNWDRSGKLTCSMCILYKINIFEMDLLDAWLTRLHTMTKSHYSESNREFQAALILSASVMARREPLEINPNNIIKRIRGPDDDDDDDDCQVIASPHNQKIKRSKYLNVMIIDTDATFNESEMSKFTNIILNIQNYTMDDVINAFHQISIENDKDFEKFLKSFYDVCLKCPYPSASAAITKVLCLELKPLKFHKKITMLICDDLRDKIASYSDEWNENENKVDNVVLVAAEFYNYGILFCQIYMNSLEKLAENMNTTKPIFIFHLSLFTTALRLIHTGDGSDLQDVYQYFKSKSKSGMKREVNRRYKQFIDHFANVFELSAATVKDSMKKLNFSFILDNLNENNFENSVKFVERMEVFKSKSAAAAFIKKTLSDMKNLDIYVRFANEIAKIKYDFTDFVQGTLVVEFGNALDVSKGSSGSTVIKPLRESEIPKVQTIIDFLIALYTSKFCNSGYLDLFLQFLSQEVCENRLKCAGYLLKILGARIERERLSMVEESFARIKFSVKSEKCKILLARIKKLWDNKWKFESDEDERSYMLAMGADWKNKEEKVEIVMKDDKKESKTKEIEANQVQKSSLSSNLNQSGVVATTSDTNESKLVQEGPKAVKLDQNQSLTSNQHQQGASSANLVQKPAETSTIPTQQETKPLTPAQIKQNFEFFTKTESDFEIFLKSLQNSATNLVSMCRNLAQKVTKSDDSQKDFLQNIWKYCLIDSSLATEAAEMCKNLTENLENFRGNLEKFIKSRICSLLAIVKSANVKEHEGVRKRMSNALLFIAALYSQDLISDNVFQSCAVSRLTSLLDCKEVADMLVILAKKINENCEENIQLQAKVLGLENLQETKFSEIFGNIKEDLMEIKGN